MKYPNNSKLNIPTIIANDNIDLNARSAIVQSHSDGNSMFFLANVNHIKSWSFAEKYRRFRNGTASFKASLIMINFHFLHQYLIMM